MRVGDAADFADHKRLRYVLATNFLIVYLVPATAVGRSADMHGTCKERTLATH